MADVPGTLTPGVDKGGLMPDSTLVGIAIVIGLVALFFLILCGTCFALWLQAVLSNAPVPFTNIIGMRLRRVDPRTIVLCHIRAAKAVLGLSTDQLEAQYLAGGDVQRVVNALIAAKRADIDLTFDTACAIDLAGRDILAEIGALVDLEATDRPIAAVGEAAIERDDESIERWPPEAPEA